jgi:hypothetical protein
MTTGVRHLQELTPELVFDCYGNDLRHIRAEREEVRAKRKEMNRVRYQRSYARNPLPEQSK